MLKQAFLVGILPHEFWKLTFREFTLCLEAYNQKISSEVEMVTNTLAWHASCIINYTSFRKNPVTPGQLLGCKSVELRDTYKNLEEFQAAMNRRYEGG